MIKKQKGISLVSLAIAVVVILTISGTVLYNLKTNLSLQRLKAMQTDIENLNGKVSNYYLQYGTLPVYKNIAIDDDYIENLVESAANSNIDIEDNYYIIDLSAMENITLNYGEDYKEIKEKHLSGEFDNTDIESLDGGRLTDIYIINSVSHNIFYVRGITYEGSRYYTQYQDENRRKIGVSGLDIDIDDIIIFKVDNKKYYAINGMRWEQWIDSNIKGSNNFMYDSQGVYGNLGENVCIENVSVGDYISITKSDYILSNAQYKLIDGN